MQNTDSGTVVGEFRGSKAGAAAMKDALRTGPDAADVTRFDVHDYADTKIRYHFSHFRILDDDRITCFEEAPHACGRQPAKQEREAREL